MSSRPLSKAEKSLVCVCVFALIPLAAVVFIAGQRDAEPDWNIAPAAPRPKPNGYDFYVAAAKSTVRFSPEVDPASDGKFPIGSSPLTSPYALQNYSLARRNSWLQRNARTWALFNQGLTTPSMSPDSAGKPMRDWSKLRQLARDVGARSRTFQLAKQPMRATLSALDGVQMAQDTSRGGGLIARLVGVAMMAIARDPLEDWNKTINSLSADEAKIAAKRLEAILSREPTTTQTLEVNKSDTLLELQRVFKDKSWRGMSSFQDTSGLNEKLSQAWQRQTLSKRAIADNMTRAFDAQIANSKLPFSKAQNPATPPGLDFFTREFVASNARFGQNDARSQTSNTMLLLRLALRSYIAQNKIAPPTLSALVPTYLKAIPSDVYNDGKPLFYQPNGATYKLWSIGPDMKNDGGVPLSRKPGTKALRPVQNTLTNTGDFVAGLCR